MDDFNQLTEEDLSTLRSEGICLKSEFFSPEHLAVLRKSALSLRERSQEHPDPSRRWLLLSPVDAIRKSLHPQSRQDLSTISNVSLSSRFKWFAQEFFGDRVHLDHILSIESPISNAAITPWHTDSNHPKSHPDFFTLKFFIYLNDIDGANGAFAYVKGTHKLITRLRQGMFEESIPHMPHSTVSDILFALADSEIKGFLLEEFSEKELERQCTVLRGLNDDEVGNPAFDLSGKAGTLLVFDDRGVHRGGIPRKGNRSILRLNYMPSRFAPVGLSRARANSLARQLLRGSVRAHW